MGLFFLPGDREEELFIRPGKSSNLLIDVGVIEYRSEKIMVIRLLSALLVVVLVPAVVPPRAETLPHVPSNAIAQSDPQDKMLQEKTKLFFDLLNRGAYAQVRELLHPSLASQFTPDDIQAIWSNLLNKTGKYQQLGDSRTIDVVNAELVLLDVVFEQGSEDFIIIFDKDGQIVGVDFPRVGSIAEISEIVIQSLADRNFPRARIYLHPLLKTELFPQEVQQRWDTLQAANGQFKKIVETDVRAGSSVDDIDVVTMTLEFAQATKQVLVIFDGQRRIVGINLVE
jgi:hypothetical protein